MERLEDAQTAARPAHVGAGRHRGQRARDRPRRGTRRPGTSPRQRRRRAAEREKLASRISRPTCWRLYDRLRAQLGGVGVGALHHKRCGGCRLDVGAADLARIATAPSDEVTAVRGVQPHPGPHCRLRDLTTVDAADTTASSSRPTGARAATPDRLATARCCATPTRAR